MSHQPPLILLVGDISYVTKNNLKDQFVMVIFVQNCTNLLL